MATSGQIDQLAAQVLARFDQGQTVDTMADDFVHLGIDDAYRVQLALGPGDIVLSGSIIRMLEVKAGQTVKVTFSRIGSVGARFI